jgi:hypothetical protein
VYFDGYWLAFLEPQQGSRELAIVSDRRDDVLGRYLHNARGDAQNVIRRARCRLQHLNVHSEITHSVRPHCRTSRSSGQLQELTTRCNFIAQFRIPSEDFARPATILQFAAAIPDLAAGPPAKSGTIVN